jgi:hypothetical protein
MLTNRVEMKDFGYVRLSPLHLDVNGFQMNALVSLCVREIIKIQQTFIVSSVPRRWTKQKSVVSCDFVSW